YNSYNASLTLYESIKDFNNSQTEANLQTARRNFKALALAYKRVESSYVAGYNSDDMRDLADFYIEHFIKGSKSADISGDLDKFFKGNGSLVKNSLKGITALEYTLFGNQESEAQIVAKIATGGEVNRTAGAMTMIETLSKNLKKVDDYYKNSSIFTTNSDKAISALLNVLVDNSYKLKETRLGDAAGYTVKYKNNPDNTRLEYYKSKNTLEAIKEILSTHKSIMQNGLKDIAIAGNASPEADAILGVIAEMGTICQSYSGAIEDELVSLKTKNLYNAANILQNNYTALINALNFTQDIIEADGD
ncbi:MAG: imelysin family protein, partial [Campylobacterota bacterium]|nr:imelysin family protein [Campylobacterota bacterium]